MMMIAPAARTSTSIAIATGTAIYAHKSCTTNASIVIAMGNATYARRRCTARMNATIAITAVAAITAERLWWPYVEHRSMKPGQVTTAATVQPARLKLMFRLR